LHLAKHHPGRVPKLVEAIQEVGGRRLVLNSASKKVGQLTAQLQVTGAQQAYQVLEEKKQDHPTMVYEGGRSRRHQMICFQLSLFQLSRLWSILW
jgi:hypothetical protein